MGIHTDIRKNLRSLWAPNAFGLRRTMVSPLSRIENVWIDDFLTRFRALQACSLDRQWYLHELFDQLVCSYLKRTQPTIYIMIIDDSTNVPQQKKETQAHRVEAMRLLDERMGRDKPVFYPTGSTFHHAEGVLMPDGTREPTIDLRRIHKGVHQNLWLALRQYIETQQSWMADYLVKFVMDCDQRGPYVLEVSADKQPQHWKQNHEWNHNLGEADTAIIWWTHFVSAADTNIHIQTIDTDLIPIYCLYHSQHSALPRCNIYWHYRDTCKNVADEDRDVVVDLQKMVESIQSCQDLPQALRDPRMFALACLLCGHDNLNRGHYANRVSTTKIFETVANMQTSFMSLSTTTDVHQWFLQFVLICNSHVVTASSTNSDILKDCSRRLRFTYYYWLNALNGRRDD